MGNQYEVKYIKRVNINGDYLIVAPKPNGCGLYETLVERAFLIDNVINFLEQHPDIDPHQITIYELHEINEQSSK